MVFQGDYFHLLLGVELTFNFPNLIFWFPILNQQTEYFIWRHILKIVINYIKFWWVKNLRTHRAYGKRKFEKIYFDLNETT